MAAVYAKEGGENFVRDGIACAVALEGREGFGCHCMGRITWDGVAKIEEWSVDGIDLSRRT